MIVSKIARHPYRGLGLATLALLAFALALLAFVRWQHESAPARLTISAGIFEGQSSEALEKFVRLAAPYHLDLRPVETSSSLDAIAQVDAGALDLAVVHGGSDFARDRNIRQVTSLQVLPLHLMVKDEIADAVASHLGALRGKVVDLGGGPETGTHRLAREILAFVGLHPGTGEQPGDYTVSTRPPLQLIAEPDRARLPDAVFLIAPLPSSVVRQLVVQQRYRLIPLPFRDAFALGAINDPDGQSSPASKAGTEAKRTILKEHIVDAVIPAFTYQADPGVPPAPLHTVGVTALLIANRRVDPEVVGRVLEALYQTRYAKIVHPPLDLHRLEEIPEVPWHPGASAHLARSKPILTGEFFSKLVDVTSIAGPICGGLLFLWQSLRQRSRLHREQSFEVYIARVSELERAALELERTQSAPLDPATLDRLWHELGQLKDEALTRFARGEMATEAMLTSFLTHVNDARAHLAHLIGRSRGDVGGRP
jgi:TRAP-type uncharacterized transport system substrate-binding protein